MFSSRKRNVLVLLLTTVLGFGVHADAKSAWKLWNDGDINAAARSATKLLSSDEDQAHHILMLTAFAQGRFQESIDQQKLISKSYSRFSQTLMPAIDSYRHLDRYRDAYAFALTYSMTEPPGLQEALRQYAANPPSFQLVTTTEVPFKVSDPFNPYLPAFDISLNGRPMTGHIDTGGTFVVISKELADQMGLKYTYFGKGHCNNKDASVWTTQTTFRLGGLSVVGIPTEISDCLDGTAMKDRIIFGTNILQRFLSTLDYPKGRLVMSPFSQRAEHFRRVSSGYRHSTKQKFHIWADHYMFTKGQISGFKGLNFFVDTGLVDFHADGRQAAFFTSTQNLMDRGYDPGNLSKADVVDISGDFGLRKLIQSGHTVKHQEKISFSDFGGVKITGLIAHSFLNQYSWTIDFERMAYDFRR